MPIDPTLEDLVDKQLDAKLFQALKKRDTSNLFHYSSFYREEVSKVRFLGDRWGDCPQTYFAQVFYDVHCGTVQPTNKIDWSQVLQQVESKRQEDGRQCSNCKECGAEEFARADLRRGVCRLFVQHPYSYSLIHMQAPLLWKLFHIRLDKSSCRVWRNLEEKPDVQSFEEIYNRFVLQVVGERFGSFVLKKACLLTHLWVVNQVLSGIREELKVTQQKYKEVAQQLKLCQATYIFDREKPIVGRRRCREFSRIHVYGRYVPGGVTSGRRRGSGRYVVRGYLVEEAWMKEFCEILQSDFGIIVHLCTEDSKSENYRVLPTNCAPYMNTSSNNSSFYMSEWGELHTELECHKDKLDVYLESRFGLSWKSFFRQVLQIVQIRWLTKCAKEERERLAWIAQEYLFWKVFQKEIVDKYLYLENCSCLQEIGTLCVFQHYEYLLHTHELPVQVEERMEMIRRKRDELYKFTLTSGNEQL